MYKNFTIDVAPVVLEFVLSPADLRLKGTDIKGAGTEARRDKRAQGHKCAGT